MPTPAERRSAQSWSTGRSTASSTCGSDGSFTTSRTATSWAATLSPTSSIDGQHESEAVNVDLTVTVPQVANFRLFTDAVLTTPGLVGSYVDRSLRDYAPQNDWRQTQTIAGTRIDPQLDFIGTSWGTRADVGLTRGADSNWEDFSVQWDGYVQVLDEPLSFWTRSDDGSRMWIDINQDGVFDPAGAEFIDNHWGTGQTPTDRTKSWYLAPGVYPIRVQHEESGGGNTLQLLAAPPPLVRVAYVIPSNRTPQPGAPESAAVTAIAPGLVSRPDGSERLWPQDDSDRDGEGSRHARCPCDACESDRRCDPRRSLVATSVAAIAEVGVDLETPGQVWLLVPEIHVQLPDGSIDGTMVGGVWWNPETDTGVVIASAAGLAYASARRSRPTTGLSWPNRAHARAVSLGPGRFVSVVAGHDLQRPQFVLARGHAA